jgi:tetratricopeptide (TPR) repeat protein
MLDLVRGHASALREIDVAGQLLVSRTPDDLRSALQLGVKRQDVATGHQVSFSMMTSWAVVGRIRRAEALARSAGSPRDVMRALANLAIALTRYGHAEIAEGILGTATDAAWADAALAKMTREAAEAHDVSTAARLAGQVGRRPYADRAFAALIRAVADAGDFEWAEDLLRSEVSEQRFKTRAVASIVAARARIGDAVTAFERAKMELDPATRSTALEALARVVSSRGNLEMFEEVLAEISDRAIVERCRAAAATLIYANGGREAVDALIESLADPSARAQASIQLTLALVDDHRLPEAEQVVARTRIGTGEATIALAIAVADTGDLDNAERLAKQISEERPRAQCLGAIARRAAALGRFDRAEYLAREIVKPEGIAATLAAVARVSYRAGGHDRGLALAAAAEELYRDNAKQRRTSRALQAMATALADTGDARRAWKLLKAITDKVDRDIAAQSVAPALVRNGLGDDAESLLKSLPNNQRAKSTRAALAIAYAEIGNEGRADELIESLVGTPQCVVVLSRLAVFLNSTGNLAGAANLAQRAARLASELTLSGTEDVLVSVVGALASVNNVDGALNRARSAEIDSTRQAAIAEVASVLADAGDVERATALIRELGEGQLADKVLIRLIRAATVADDLPLTFSLLDQLQDDWSRSVARGTVVRLLVNTRPELCDGLLWEAANFARRSSDPARALADTAAAAYCAELTQPARRLLAEAFTRGPWISLLPALSQVDPTALAELADAYVRQETRQPDIGLAQLAEASPGTSRQTGTAAASQLKALTDNRGAVTAWSAGVSGVAATFAGVLASRATTPLSQNPWFIICVVIACLTFAILLGVGFLGLISWWRSREPNL